ncbi:MAG TPA: hypothetical protein VFV67_32110 [Actinophytocola sp.]|uniref:hypothetical protein n=1 Tax=Actinophytocola sp. TaxID=1872138 RepID=UPI002DBC5EC5|nr:hypothetical protein [Actinophytocola sp.]HEU5475311.1 hypothetical protein [Actinophytocola sp.]
MHGDLRDMLKCWLGHDAQVLDELSDPQLEQLHAALVDARKRQAGALKATSLQALRQIPTLLRRSVDKIVSD